MYSIYGLCPDRDRQLGGFGFSIMLFPLWKEIVAASDMTQEKCEHALKVQGDDWLAACGYSGMFDPDNCGFDRDKTKPPGPNAYPSYKPNRDLRVRWGEWGLEHITVPGNACGLDIDRCISAPIDGRCLVPHNVDNWRQVQLLLVTFTWFADCVILDWQIKGNC